jgi:hypothetical protein
MSFITINDVLNQIHEDTGNTEAVNYITNIIPVVEEYVFDILNRYSSGYTSGYTSGTTLQILPYRVKQAMLSYAGTLYNNRESISPNQMYGVKDVFEKLLAGEINYGSKY